MRRLEIKDVEIIRLVVQDDNLYSEKSRCAHLLHGILLVCSGFSCSEIVTLQFWMISCKPYSISSIAGAN
jgi:hypothetical protein